MLIKLYRFLITICSPFFRLYFYARCLYGKDKRESVINHFGIATLERPKGKLIWVHAASIGESTSALTFISHIKKQFPDLNVLITTVTVTSAEILRPKIAKIPNCFHQFVVADNSSWIKRFMDYWKIDVAVFLESEIWPNIISEIHERLIPLFLLNARLSSKSFRRWSHFKSSFREILRKFTCILAQSEIDRERYASFSPENTKRIDNLKHANAVLACNEGLLATFRRICKGKIVFIAASTHEKEEDIILEAHKKLRKHFDIVTIIIPRHLTRVKRVCEIIEHYNYSFALRSEINENSKCEVYCIDTFGEVGTFFRLADICFVGGSLVKIGGHNIYEPVTFGKPVLFGPHMENVIEVRDFLKAKELGFEVNSSDDIYNICEQLLSGNTLKNIHERVLSITKNNSLNQIDEIMQLSRILS